MTLQEPIPFNSRTEITFRLPLKVDWHLFQLSFKPKFEEYGAGFVSGEIRVQIPLNDITCATSNSSQIVSYLLVDPIAHS